MKTTETASSEESVLGDILGGLSEEPPRLPSKYFYDQRGSDLFEQICQTPEYYPTRTELRILNDRKSEICRAIGENAVLIEPGCGSCRKTRILLDHHPSLRAFIPIDISESFLYEVAQDLRESYPGLPVLPLSTDFMKPFKLPEIDDGYSRKVVFYPGSTLGNFLPDRARRFLKQMAELTGPGGRFILGVDHKKSPDVLRRAYNDARGLTAEFNRNILVHLNRRMGAEVFDVDGFKHRAVWNEEKSRIEMHLVAKSRQTIRAGDSVFEFDRDDYIVTEYSHKYTGEMVTELARGLFSTGKVWTDKNNYFGLYCLEAL
jgi:dimethylhistidine N-methyltransferase